MLFQLPVRKRLVAKHRGRMMLDHDVPYCWYVPLAKKANTQTRSRFPVNLDFWASESYRRKRFLGNVHR
jgi:hypothetical protein